MDQPRARPRSTGDSEECQLQEPVQEGRNLLHEKLSSGGVVLWNADDLLEKARDLIRVNPMIRNDQLKRAIPLAPDDWLMVKKEHGRREGRKMVTEDDRESLVQVRSKEVGDGRGDH